MSDDLPAHIVSRLERARTESVGAMRATVYDALAEHGIDVSRLVEAERAAIVADARASADESAARRRLLADRVASGRLTPRQAASAQRQIAHLDVREKEVAREARRILRRAEVPATRQIVPSAPTPERLRRWGEDVATIERERDGSALSGPRFELRWAVDRMVVALEAHEYVAATRLRETWAQRQSTPRTVDLNGSGGGVPGSRLPVSDCQLAAGREWNAIWHRLPPGVRLIVMNFICEEAPRGRAAPMTAVEFGAVYGTVRGDEAARGVTRGAVKTALAVISSLFHDYDAWRAEEARKQKQQGGSAR